jgi:hypothetical protein
MNVNWKQKTTLTASISAFPNNNFGRFLLGDFIHAMNSSRRLQAILGKKVIQSIS